MLNIELWLKFVGLGYIWHSLKIISTVIPDLFSFFLKVKMIVHEIKNKSLRVTSEIIKFA